MSKRAPPKLLAVPEAAAALEVSESTVWRLLRAGTMESVVSRGRRLIPLRAVERRKRASQATELRPLTSEHPLWRLVGSARSGGASPDSSDKYGILTGE